VISHSLTVLAIQLFGKVLVSPLNPLENSHLAMPLFLLNTDN